MKRSGFVLAIALAVAGVSARAETPPPPPPAQDAAGLQPMPPADWLFAQTGSGFTSDGKTLTITRVSAQTLMFSDRPERMTADAPTAKFVAFWTEGRSSFEKDPPNASVAFTADGKPDLAVVELRNPRIEGDTLTYDIKMLEGTLPEKGGDVSLFIDWWYGPVYRPAWGWHPGPGPEAWPGGRCWRNPYGHLHCRPWWAD